MGVWLKCWCASSLPEEKLFLIRHTFFITLFPQRGSEQNVRLTILLHIFHWSLSHTRYEHTRDFDVTKPSRNNLIWNNLNLCHSVSLAVHLYCLQRMTCPSHVHLFPLVVHKMFSTLVYSLIHAVLFLSFHIIPNIIHAIPLWSLWKFRSRTFRKTRLLIHMLELVECIDYISFLFTDIGRLLFYNIMFSTKSTPSHHYSSFDLLFMIWIYTNSLESGADNYQPTGHCGFHNSIHDITPTGSDTVLSVAVNALNPPKPTDVSRTEHWTIKMPG